MFHAGITVLLSSMYASFGICLRGQVDVGSESESLCRECCNWNIGTESDYQLVAGTRCLDLGLNIICRT